jgi:leader peptidase (prepilin peptidase)/N-methyltransferase
MLRKTVSRTVQFIGRALALRHDALPYAPLAYGLLAGAVWLMVGLAGEPGWLVTTVAALALLCLLAAICAIDARFGVIPDSLVVALSVGGCLATMATGTADAAQRMGEAGIMFATGWLFRAAYFRVRGMYGLGFGDVKLAAAGVLWTGLVYVPTVILIAVGSALACLGVLHAQGHRLNRRDAIAFGPHLALGIWLAWIAGIVGLGTN